MPKLTQNFVRGRMNKDLDERLVPKGEYRDGQNIQVSTSEGSDVGAVENVLGNVLKNFEGTGDWDPNFGLTNATTIGAVRDTSNNKLYWFLTSDEADAILEFDQTTGIVAPVLVDINNVLNFSTSNLITGVNILENQLFWTDDLNEPRVINTDTFKAGSDQGSNIISVHTQVYGRDFISSDVTVIKKAPQEVLTVVASPSIYSGPGTGIDPVGVTHNFFGEVTGNIVNISLDQAISWSGIADTTFSMTTYITNEDNSRDEFEVTGEIDTYTSASDVDILITSISADVPNLALDWELLLVEGEPIFKNDFPRFSYRYKYSNGEYSPYATFSNAAFVPGDFEYLSRDGNNIGMESVIRKIDISGFQTTPKDVDEVEVLYKGSDSNNVYLIHSFKYDFSEPIQPVLSLTLTSKSLGRVIESVQLLRLFDAVPKKAKAQEVIGNRVIYANYEQNYTIENSSIDIVASQANATHSNVKRGLASVKTNRDYQIGVSFIDDYGRETPVFTSNTGSITLDGRNSPKVNSLRAKLNTFTPPSWVDKFKYYVKDPSAAYYNIALDRYYDAEDGGVWLSFPSSERNKIKEGQYLTLKKEHDNDNPVTINNKYKVLSIENEAPDYIKYLKTVVGRVKVFRGGSPITDPFVIGSEQINFLAPTKDRNENFFEGFNKKCFIQFFSENATGGSNIYEIVSGGPTGDEVEISAVLYSYFSCTLVEGIKSSDLWLTQLATGERITAVLYHNEINQSPDFVGRFFTKIKSNGSLEQNIKEAFADTSPSLVTDKTEAVLYDQMPNVVTSPSFAWDDIHVASNPGDGLTLNSDTFYISAADTSATPWFTSQEKIFWDKLAGGTYLEFVFINGDKSEKPYKIIDVVTQTDTRVSPGTGESQTKTITLDRPYTDKDPAIEKPFDITVLKTRFKGESTSISSSNPAIFETEPDELADLDLYYEATEPIDKSNINAVQTLSWSNCYSFGNGVESDRIRDDFNAPTIGKGVRVSSTIEEPYREERRANGLIFSGIFNSTSGINNTNQFLIAEDITKDIDPSYGSIQKLHARDTNLVTLCEDKSLRILADKDALFEADGNPNITASRNVLGQTIPFAGEFGISKNPESFASFGFRAYYTDKARGAVIRLSNDGITVISDKNMSYYFNQELKAAAQPLIGSYDEDTGTYNVRIDNKQLSFQESVDGWTTRLTYAPEFAISLNTEYYTFNGGELYEHSDDTNRANFYGVQNDTTVTTIINDGPSSIKNFKTLSYEGDDGWTASITTNSQEGVIDTWKQKEGLYFNFIKGEATTLSNIDTSEFSVQGLSNLATNPPHNGTSYTLTMVGAINVSLQVGDIVYYHDGTLNQMGECAAIDRLNKTITVATPAITVNPPVIGDFVLFAKDGVINKSGIVGYYANIVLTNTNSSKKELFAVNSEAFISSE